jgi:hypothetical protein
MAAHPFLDPEAIAQWAREVGITAFTQAPWGWPILEVFHFIGLCLLFGAVGMFDLRMLGVARGVSLRALHRLIPFGIAGFATSAISGFLFVVSAPDQYLYNPALQTKLALMGLAGVNMALFYATAARAVSSTGPDDLPPSRARLFGLVSLACWLGVIACGRVITAFRPPWNWCLWC